MVRDDLIEWLLQGDPAIRWQVMRDLVGAGESTYMAERARVAVSGWGRQVLDHQNSDGLWGGSLYNGKWTSTTYALYLLKLLGLPPGHHGADGPTQPLGHFAGLAGARPVGTDTTDLILGMTAVSVSLGVQ